LAAIGGELRLRREALNSDPRVRSPLQEVVQLIDPGLLDGINAEQERTALAFIQTSFRDRGKVRPPFPWSVKVEYAGTEAGSYRP
jgi:hypothetical protein